MLQPRLLISGALALFPAPALADVTARYEVGKEQLVVEVDDNGDYRAELAGKFALIRHGSDEFVVITHNGKAHAAKSDVFFTLLRAKAAGAPVSVGPASTMRFVTTSGEDEVIAGRKGSGWRIALEERAAHTITVVMSSDAQLAPVGGVLRSGIARGLEAFTPIFDGNMSLRDQLNAVFAKGTPLRIVGPETIVLQSVSGDAIAADRFATPAVLLDAPALAAALGEPARPSK